MITMTYESAQQDAQRVQWPTAKFREAAKVYHMGSFRNRVHQLAQLARSTTARLGLLLSYANRILGLRVSMTHCFCSGQHVWCAKPYAA